jgi:hypothetical protein
MLQCFRFRKPASSNDNTIRVLWLRITGNITGKVKTDSFTRFHFPGWKCPRQYVCIWMLLQYEQQLTISLNESYHHMTKVSVIFILFEIY